jgi:hypothetical protein
MGEWRYSSTYSLTSALDGGEWSASRSGRFTPRERASVIHWIGGWVGPRAVLENGYLGNNVERRGLYTSCLGQGPVASCCKHENELWSSIKGGIFVY